MTANILRVADYAVVENGFNVGKEIQNVGLFINNSPTNTTGVKISGDIEQVVANANNPGTTFAGNVFAPTIKATNAAFAGGGGVTFSGVSVFSSGLSATGITANTVFANSIVGTNATFTNATFTNDVTVTGNLTVDGTVITANVANIVIEDPLIKLGTGNNGDTYDLGFYGQYVGANTDKRFTGLFRDRDSDGKYRLFTGLTGGAEPGTEVNILGAGYTVATLIAKLDGGTF
jgi:hypothetical protein